MRSPTPAPLVIGDNLRSADPAGWVVATSGARRELNPHHSLSRNTLTVPACTGRPWSTAQVLGFFLMHGEQPSVAGPNVLQVVCIAH